MDSQNSPLKGLVEDMLAPLKTQPHLLIEKLLPQNKLPMYYSLIGILQSPFSPMKGFDPNQLIVNLVDKLENVSDEFWKDLGNTLQGVLNGEQEAIEKAKELLKVV